MNIDGNTRLLGLIGNPIEHTMSPIIHNTISDSKDINNVYVPFRVEDNSLSDAIQGAYALNILGLNITVPYKNEVIKELVDIDDTAKHIKAVNTLVRTQTGYKGYNTDMLGLLRAITAEDIYLEDRNIIILGAGGAARAVAYMCLVERASKVYILNRTLDNAVSIVEDMKNISDKNTTLFEAMDMDRYSLLDDDKYIVFQTTSVGLSPNNNRCIIDDKEFYKNVEIGIDLIYNPAVTRFMELVQDAGGRAINGLKMLLYQGVIAYELWNDVQVSDDLCDDIYIKLYRNIHGINDNVVLIGYMGSGKTTVGKALAKSMGYNFIDTDALIEEMEDMPISSIFEVKGEEYFRKLETSVIRNLTRTTRKTIFSTGGGLPVNRINANLIKQLGAVIYLKADVDTIWKRVRYSTTRPILNCEDPYNKIIDTLGYRESFYNYASDYTISVDNVDVKEIVDNIMRMISDKDI